MDITQPAPITEQVEDIDFSLSTGATVPFTLYPSRGDSIRITADAYELCLIQPKTLQAETVTIHKRHVVWTSRRARTITIAAPKFDPAAQPAA
jgi:hypothetical protein